MTSDHDDDCNKESITTPSIAEINDDDDNDDENVERDYKSGLASSRETARDQRDHKSLSGCWKLAKRDRGGFMV